MGCDKTMRLQLFQLCVILPPLDQRPASLALFEVVPGKPQQDKDSPLEMAALTLSYSAYAPDTDEELESAGRNP